MVELQNNLAMNQVKVAIMEFSEGGRAIWIHDKKGSTVVRIHCTGQIKLHSGCENICVHTDINVSGDIDICVP